MGSVQLAELAVEVRSVHTAVGELRGDRDRIRGGELVTGQCAGEGQITPEHSGQNPASVGDDLIMIECEVVG